MKDVHTEHCCLRHGCKYGDDKCTVTTGKERQSYPCEDCDGYIGNLPVPRFKKVREIVQLENAIGFICPDHNAGRRAMYTTWVINLETGRATVIGRELPLDMSRDQITEYKRRHLLKERW